MHEVWLLAVTCLLTLASGEPRCGGEWRNGLALDLEVTKSSNATLAVVGVYNVQTKDDCERGCCHSPSGACSVASFHRLEGNGTCYLYKCIPLSSCTLSPKNGTDTFMLGFLWDNDPANTSNVNDSLAPVHGDGGQSKPRKGVFPQEIEEGPLKHDNTTVKPRKGVLKEHYVNTVKARKGVEKETLTISSDVFSDDLSVANNSFNDIIGPSSMTLSLVSDTGNPSHVEQNTSDSTMLRQSDQMKNTTKEAVGDEQSNFTKATFSNPTSSTTIIPQYTQTHLTTQPTKSSTTAAPTMHNSAAGPTKSNSAAVPTMPNPAATPTMPNSAAVPTKSNSAAVPTISISAAASTIPNSAAVPTKSNSAEVPTFSISAAAPTMPNSAAASTIFSSAAETTSSSTTTRTAEPDAVKSENSSTHDDSQMSDWEFVQTSTSLHLVIGLVLGLMLLLTVMGVIAKRIHDSWQRRHYHRMDFLIDGMYHGES